MYEPVIFLNFEYFDRIVDLLLCWTEKATKSINKLIIDRAGWQVVPLVLHRRHLYPFVLLDNVLLDRVETLFTAEATQHKDITLAHGDSVRVSRLIHWLLIDHLIFLKQVNPRVFFGRGSTTRYQNFSWRKRNGGWTLVKFADIWVWQLFKGPFIFVNIVTKRDFWIDIVTEQQYFCLILLTGLK